MDRRSKTYLILATIVALLAICVAVWALFFRAPETPADPEISPVADEHLTPTDDGDDEKMPQAEGGGAVNITYSSRSPWPTRQPPSRSQTPPAPIKVC